MNLMGKAPQAGSQGAQISLPREARKGNIDEELKI